MSGKERLTIGFAITGSFCTYEKIKEVLRVLVKQNLHVIPIFSNEARNLDTRFGKAEDFVKEVREITGEQGICTIPQAEPIGPFAFLDILVIAPCTGNTLAKLCGGITDTPVLMAAKAHLRNEKPLLISVSTNDAMGMNFKNIGALYNMKHVYFVPFGQDDCIKKPNSLIAHVELIPQSIQAALQGKQLQPILRAY